MAKYTANIVAKVEMGQLDKLKSQIEALEKNEINLKFSANGLNLNNLVNQINSQFSKAGASAGQNFGNNITSSIKSATANVGRVTANSMSQLKNEFKNFNIDSSIADKFEESLKKAKITVNDIKASIKESGDNSTVKLTVSGVDELGVAKTAVQEFKKTADEWKASTGIEIKIGDVSGVKAQAEASAEAYKELTVVAKEYANARNTYAKLSLSNDSDVLQTQQAYENMQKLKSEYESLKSSKIDLIDEGQVASLDKIVSDTTQINKAMASAGDASFNGLNNLIAKEEEAKSKIAELRAETAKKIQIQIGDDNWKTTLSGIVGDIRTLASKGSSSVSTLSEELKQLKATRDSLKDKSGDELISGFEKYDQQLQSLQAHIKTAKNEMKGLASAASISRASSSFETWLSKNSKALDKYGDKIDEVRKQLAKFKEVGATTSELNNVKTAIDNIKTTAASQGNLGVTWVDKLGDQFKKLSTYVSAASVIYTGIRALKSMYSAVSDIDTQMTELKKVTDETDATYSQFLDGAKSKAVELGVTVSDLVSATADFARLGYSMQEATNLAQVATIYANVGDDVGSIEEATSSIISTMKAFNMTSEQSILIVDKFNEVGNKFAISSGGIGQALLNSASTMSQANNTLDQSIALITGASISRGSTHRNMLYKYALNCWKTLRVA